MDNKTVTLSLTEYEQLKNSNIAYKKQIDDINKNLPNLYTVYYLQGESAFRKDSYNLFYIDITNDERVKQFYDYNFIN